MCHQQTDETILQCDGEVGKKLSLKQRVLRLLAIIFNVYDFIVPNISLTPYPCDVDPHTARYNTSSADMLFPSDLFIEIVFSELPV